MDGYPVSVCLFVFGYFVVGNLYSRGVRRRTAGKQGDFSQGDKLPACVQIQLCIIAGAALPRLFGAVYLRIDTPGGGLQNADLQVMLRKKDCQKIVRMLQVPQGLTPLSPDAGVYSKKQLCVFTGKIT